MDKGITIAGNMIVDQIKFIERYPRPQALTTITGTVRALGGLACNCLVDLAKLDPDIPLHAVGMVGRDDAGDFVLEELGRHPSIDCSGILREGITSFTDVMTQDDGLRTFFQYRGANALLGPEHFDFAQVRTSLLHVGYILLLDRLDGPDPDYPTALCRVLAQARAQGIATSIDVVSEEGMRYASIVPPALRYTDYCVINELEAGQTTGIPLREGETLRKENFAPCLRALADMGVSRWVVIHTPELSCGLDVASGELVQEASWRIPAGFNKSSVGAGDAFASGILLGAYHGWSLARAIRTAGAIAAYSLSGSGASDAIKPLPQLLAEMESFQIERIQP